MDKKVIYLLRVISFFERSLYCEMSRSTVLGGGGPCVRPCLVTSCVDFYTATTENTNAI